MNVVHCFGVMNYLNVFCWRSTILSPLLFLLTSCIVASSCWHMYLQQQRMTGIPTLHLVHEERAQWIEAAASPIWTSISFISRMTVVTSWKAQSLNQRQENCRAPGWPMKVQPVPIKCSRCRAQSPQEWQRESSSTSSCGGGRARAACDGGPRALLLYLPPGQSRGGAGANPRVSGAWIKWHCVLDRVQKFKRSFAIPPSRNRRRIMKHGTVTNSRTWRSANKIEDGAPTKPVVTMTQHSPTSLPF